MTSADGSRNESEAREAQEAADDDVARYAARVRAELADLTEGESAELLEDLEDHLREVAVEDTGDLVDRLGPPSAYARELRVSAGLPPRPADATFTGASGAASTASKTLWRRRIADRGVRLRTAATDTAVGGAVADFLPSLRPAWWVLRGWLAVVLVQFLTDGSDNTYPIPSPYGSSVLGFVLLMAAIPGSIWLARRPPLSGNRRRTLIVGNVVLAVVALAAFGNVQNQTGNRYSPSPQGFGYGYGPDSSGLVDGGRPITNLFVYDASGHLVDGALVYDQDGNPVETVGPDDALQVEQWRDDQGFPVLNRFPQRQSRIDYTFDGTPHAVAIPWIMVQVPQGVHLASPSQSPASPAPTSAPTPTPTSSPSPGALPAQPGATPAQPTSATSAPTTPRSSPTTTG